MSPFKRHKKSICVKSKTKYTSSKKLAKQQKLPIGKKKIKSNQYPKYFFSIPRSKHMHKKNKNKNKKPQHLSNKSKSKGLSYRTWPIAELLPKLEVLAAC